MFKVEAMVDKWLRENQEAILKNISDTIVAWLDENKEEIYEIIRENSGTN